MPGLSPQSTRPMEARLVDTLPETGHWQFEPKWDGFRCLAFKQEDVVELRAKSGKPLTRYFPEIVDCLRKVPVSFFIVDGELAVPVGNALAFDALQARLHPAESRVRKLAAETPARLILFDVLRDAAHADLSSNPLAERRSLLEALLAKSRACGLLRLSPATRSAAQAQKWLQTAGSGSLDGVVAKALEAPYVFGEREMLKVKRLRTADCVVGGFRYAQRTKIVGSLLLGLFDDGGKLDHVGFTASFSAEERRTLTKKLMALRGPPGFTGTAPGGPSRWATERTGEWEPLRTRLVAEVRYDQVTGRKFRHGTTFLRWRPDKAPEQCTFEQLTSESRPGKIIADIVRSRPFK